MDYYLDENREKRASEQRRRREEAEIDHGERVLRQQMEDVTKIQERMAKELQNIRDAKAKKKTDIQHQVKEKTTTIVNLVLDTLIPQAEIREMETVEEPTAGGPESSIQDQDVQIMEQDVAPRIVIVDEEMPTVQEQEAVQAENLEEMNPDEPEEETPTWWEVALWVLSKSNDYP